MMRLVFLRTPGLRRNFTTTPRCLQSSTIDLAFTRHEPPASSESSQSKPPMIVMHGLFGSQRNNRTFSKTLAQKLGRPVYTIDLRNHGDSPHHQTHTYAAMSEDVENFLRSQKLLASTKPILIGHSMGAKVAMALALRRPTAYSGIVPLDNSPVDAALKSDFAHYVRGMLEIEAQDPPLSKQSDADKILEKYESSLPIRQFLLTNLVKDPEDKKKLKWRIPLGTLSKSLDNMADFPFKDPEQARFEGPVLVIRGGESRYVADETLPVMGRFFPRFELVDIPGVGHWVVSEAFEESVNAVVDWTRRVVDQEAQ